MRISVEIPTFASANYIHRSVKIKEIVCALEHFAPLPLQESYDNAGLQVGLTEVEASGALLCLDVTEEVMQEAIDLGCNVVISHHPLLFRPLRTLTDNTQVERVVRMAVQHDIAVYSAHTNLDNAEDGVNYKIAEKLSLMDVQMIGAHTVRVKEGSKERSVKAGSGVIGYLPQPMESAQFLEWIKGVFRVDCLMHNAPLQRPIQSVALCGGAGDFVLQDALQLEADAFLTGEMHYHQYFGNEQRIQIAVLGHYQSEQYTMEIIRTLLEEKAPDLPVFVTRINTNPIMYL